MDTKIGMVRFDSVQMSEWIGLLHRQSQQVSQAEFKSWCFQHLQQVLPFDSGIWLSRSDLVERENRFLAADTSLFNLTNEFMDNYTRIASRPNNPDLLEQSLISKPGYFFSLWDVCTQQQWYQTDYYLEHCVKYNIENAMAVLMLPSKYSKVTHIVSFYRKDKSQWFTAEEKAKASSLLPQLMEAFSANLLTAFGGRNKAAYRAVLDRFGEVIVAEEGFNHYMQLHSLISQERVILPELKELTEPVRVRKDELILDLNFSEGMIYVEAFHGSPDDRLTNRQKQIAQLVTKGFTNKEIADLLELKVTTVNAHVRKIFKALGVTSRHALSSYLVRQDG